MTLDDIKELLLNFDKADNVLKTKTSYILKSNTDVFMGEIIWCFGYVLKYYSKTSKDRRWINRVGNKWRMNSNMLKIVEDKQQVHRDSLYSYLLLYMFEIFYKMKSFLLHIYMLIQLSKINLIIVIDRWYLWLVELVVNFVPFCKL